MRVPRVLRPLTMTGKRIMLLAMMGVGMVLLAMTRSTFAADDLADVQAAFLRREYGLVASKTQELLNRSASLPKDDLLYLQGISCLKLRDLETARAALNRLLVDYPRSRWFAQASLAAGDVELAAGDSEKALGIYQNLLSDERAKPLGPQVIFRLGQVQRGLGLWDRAKDSLQSVVTQAPKSPEAAQAKELLEKEDFYFSVQVGAFSSKANAQRLKAELDRRGLNAEVSEALMQGRQFYRVRIGRFGSRQEAQQQEQRLRADGFPAKVVP